MLRYIKVKLLIISHKKKAFFMFYFYKYVFQIDTKVK